MLGLENVAPYSQKKCWFICDEGHEWETRLYNRTKEGTGCPICNRKRATITNNLLAKYPQVAAEWHPTRNGDLTPKDVAGRAGRKVWWQCKKGHEWEALVSNRTSGKNCRECAIDKKRGTPVGTQSLLAAHPTLAQQWHPTKNGVLTPDAVSRAARRKVWWQCPSDPTHEWETLIRSRSLGKQSGCPFGTKTGPRPLCE
eukprot:Colp12_sorted_trinity150504_noHs@4727